MLSILLRFSDSDYPFGIFKLFFLGYILRIPVRTLYARFMLNFSSGEKNI
jgi:hypothetical protein